MVFKALLAYIGRVVKVPAIKDNLVLKLLCDQFEVWCAKFLPFRKYHHCITIVFAFIASPLTPSLIVPLEPLNYFTILSANLSC